MLFLYISFLLFFFSSYFIQTFKFSNILHIIKLFIFFSHFCKIKHIIFYLNSKNKIFLIKSSHEMLQCINGKMKYKTNTNFETLNYIYNLVLFLYISFLLFFFSSYFIQTFKFSNILHTIKLFIFFFSHFCKIKHIIFYLNSKNKNFLTKSSNEMLQYINGKMKYKINTNFETLNYIYIYIYI